MAFFPRFVSQLSLRQACKITNFKRRKYLILLAVSEAHGASAPLFPVCSKVEYHGREPGLEESGPLLWPQSTEKGKTSLSTVPSRPSTLCHDFLPLDCTSVSTMGHWGTFKIQVSIEHYPYYYF